MIESALNPTRILLWNENLKFWWQSKYALQVSKPKCQMFGCEGPLPNDGSIRFKLLNKPLHSCYQTFVPLNACVGDKGYPVGMVCTICCDCTNSFIAEMRNSRGYKIGFSRKWTRNQSKWSFTHRIEMRANNYLCCSSCMPYIDKLLIDVLMPSVSRQILLLQFFVSDRNKRKTQVNSPQRIANLLNNILIFNIINQESDYLQLFRQALFQETNLS